MIALRDLGLHGDVLVPASLVPPYDSMVDVLETLVVRTGCWSTEEKFACSLLETRKSGAAERATFYSIVSNARTMMLKSPGFSTAPVKPCPSAWDPHPNSYNREPMPNKDSSLYAASPTLPSFSSSTPRFRESSRSH